MEKYVFNIAVKLHKFCHFWIMYVVDENLKLEHGKYYM
jgi:hypothetical protein